MEFLIVCIFVLVLVAAMLAGCELYGLRQSVDRLRRSEEQANAEFTGWFRVLEGAVLDCKKEDNRTSAALEEIWVVLDEMKDRMQAISGLEETISAFSASLEDVKEDTGEIFDLVECAADLRCRQRKLEDSLAELKKLSDSAAKWDNQWTYMHQALAVLTNLYGELAASLTRLEALLKGTACQSGPDLDSQLSKSMEEGIMNLMQYAAGKTSGGVEVGLG